MLDTLNILTKPIINQNKETTENFKKQEEALIERKQYYAANYNNLSNSKSEKNNFIKPLKKSIKSKNKSENNSKEISFDLKPSNVENINNILDNIMEVGSKVNQYTSKSKTNKLSNELGNYLSLNW